LEVAWDEPSGRTRVTNRLGVPIRFGLLKTENGFEFLEEVDADSTQTGRLISESEALLRVTRLTSQINQQVTPPGAWNSIFRAQQPQDRGCLQAVLGNSSVLIQQMNPGEYVCWVNGFSLAQGLRPDTVYNADWHIVHGQW
jgi:hypothetical protein